VSPPYGQPAAIQPTTRSRSEGLGLGFVPFASEMGNCWACGEAGQTQLGSWTLQTPHRIVSLFLATIGCVVKSSPVGSLPAWHSTQYVEKNPIAQLAQVSPEPSVERASCVAGASASLVSKLAASLTDEPDSLEPESLELVCDDPADEHPDAIRPKTARTRSIATAILDYPRRF
jgi:hypothetical protein